MNRIFLILILFAFNNKAQEKLNLNSCLNILFEQSAQFKMLKLQSERDELNYRISTIFKKPTMDLSLGIPLKFNQGVEDVFNSSLNQYTLILNSTSNFTPVASLLSNYNLPTGGTIKFNMASLYNTYNSEYSNDRERFEYSFYGGISQPIFRVNNYRITAETSENEFQKAKLSFFKNKNELIFNAIEMFYKTLLKQKELDLTKHKIGKELEELKEQKLKLQLGKTSEIQFINKELAVKTSELNLSRLSSELNIEKSKLFSFLGINSDLSIKLEEAIELIAFNFSIEDALELVVKNNPDYKILTLNLSIGQLDLETKTSTDIETDLTASVFYSNQLYHQPIERKIKNYDYDFGVIVKIPILDGGKWDVEADLAAIKLSEIQNDLTEKEKELKFLVTDYYNLLQFLENQHLLHKEKLEIFRNSYEIYKLEFNLGKLSFFELQEHENEIFNAEKSVIETVINYNKSVLQLKTILGMEIFNEK